VSPPGVTELLAVCTVAHRRAVAITLGLPESATAEEINETLTDRRRIMAIVAGLSPQARRLVAGAAFLGEVNVYEQWGGRPIDAALELERHGLAFAFKHRYEVQYWVPRQLHSLLADAIAVAYPAPASAAEPARWIELPLQLAYDIAAIWAFLSRTPVRVKTDGVVYQRDIQKLFDALPAAKLHGPDDPLDGRRLGIVMAVLREEGLVRVRVSDRPGADGRRELIAIGDPAALLAMEPPALRARLLTHAGHAAVGAPGSALMRVLESGATVALTGVGATLRQMLSEAGVGTADGSDFGFGLAAVHMPLLVGALALGVDGDGVPTVARNEPAVVSPPGRIICQANFELVALSRPTPSQALVLAVACEAVPGQAHVFKLTRKSAQAAQRSGVLRDGLIAALEQLAGELPQNVARSLRDWTASVHRALRLRTALILDAGDSATADALLAGDLASHVVERLGPAQLAIDGADVKAVEKALRRAGHELDAGIDRVSGHFEDRSAGGAEAVLAWLPQDQDELGDMKPISTLAKAAGKPVREPAPATPLRLIDGEQDPVEVVLDAVERGTDVFIVYAGADGTTQHDITPYRVDGAAVRAYCHAHREERVFWLSSIQAAVGVG
jgi:hypothetical protein